MTISLRRVVAAPLLALMASASWAAEPLVEMHKDPNCGCCTAWAEHLKDEGFVVEMHNAQDMRSIKAEHGVPHDMASCHTAIVEGYVIEGHVPAADIRRLLESDEAFAGLAVPGMPHGSPGMETGRYDDYAVIGWYHDERAPEIFKQYTFD